MPKGTPTTTIISMLSAVPPRARQRRVAMIMATMIPAIMHSAYARSGKDADMPDVRARDWEWTEPPAPTWPSPHSPHHT